MPFDFFFKCPGEQAQVEIELSNLPRICWVKVTNFDLPFKDSRIIAFAELQPQDEPFILNLDLSHSEEVLPNNADLRDLLPKNRTGRSCSIGAFSMVGIS